MLCKLKLHFVYNFVFHLSLSSTLSKLGSFGYFFSILKDHFMSDLNKVLEPMNLENGLETKYDY